MQGNYLVKYGAEGHNISQKKDKGVEMKKIYIGSDDSDLIFDVSSTDVIISHRASSTIQAEFEKAAIQLGELIRRRVEEKRLKNILGRK